MEKIRVIMTMFKETPGSYHYRVPINGERHITSYPASDLYIRKSFFNGRKPPNIIEIEVKAID